MGKWESKDINTANSNRKSGFFRQDKSGKISQYLGTGENAKYSILYLVLKYSFLSAVGITVLVIVNYWTFRDANNKVPDIVGDMKVIWEIIIPVITLTLGYAFGKNTK